MIHLEPLLKEEAGTGGEKDERNMTRNLCVSLFGATWGCYRGYVYCAYVCKCVCLESVCACMAVFVYVCVCGLSHCAGRVTVHIASQ